MLAAREVMAWTREVKKDACGSRERSGVEIGLKWAGDCQNSKRGSGKLAGGPMERGKGHTVLVVGEAGIQGKDDINAKRKRIWVGRGESGKD